MKVQELLEQLKNLDPQEEVCAMLFTRHMFEAHEYKVPKEEWNNLCASFDSSPMTSNVFEELSMSIDYEEEMETL